MLVTGQGFPPLAVRACVYRLAEALDLPVLGLVDCNPFGENAVMSLKNPIFACGCAAVVPIDLEVVEEGTGQRQVRSECPGVLRWKTILRDYVLLVASCSMCVVYAKEVQIGKAPLSLAAADGKQKSSSVPSASHPSQGPRKYHTVENTRFPSATTLP